MRAGEMMCNLMLTHKQFSRPVYYYEDDSVKMVDMIYAL